MSDRQNSTQNSASSIPQVPADTQTANGTVPAENDNNNTNGEYGDGYERRVQHLFASDDNTRMSLLHDYSQWKNILAASFFNSLVSLTIIEEPNITFSPDFFPHNVPDASSSKHTFSSALEILRTALRRNNPKSFRICIVTLNELDTLISKAFPNRSKIFVTPGQLSRKYQAPLVAILTTIYQEWECSPFTFIQFPDRLEDREHYTLRRPTQTTDDPSFTINSAKDVNLELKWIASAPHYKGSRYTYVWEPHIKPPVPIRMRIFVSHETENGSRNFLVLRESWVKSPSSTSPGKHPQESLLSAESEYEKLENEWGRLDIGTEDLHAKMIYRGLCVALLKVVQDTTFFVESAQDELAELKYTGRQRPSAGKLHFLLHFEDCYRLSQSGLAHASQILDQINQSVTDDHSHVKKFLQDWAGKCRGDIKYLEENLKHVREEIDETRNMLKSQLDLRNGRRTALLTLLAAVYIPFAFISSLFGMNISQPIWGGIISTGMNDSPTNLTNGSSSVSTATAISNTTLFSENATDAIINSISSSGPYLWTLELYWIIAAPITLATILLPLVAGLVFRLVLKFSYYNRHYARLILFVVLVTGLTMADYYLVDPYFTDFFGIGCGIPTLLILCRFSWVGEAQLLWCGFSIIFAGALVYDWYLYPVALASWVPFAYLLICWMIYEFNNLPGPQAKRFRSYLNQRFPWSSLREKAQHRRWIWQLCVVLIYYGVAAALYITVPGFINIIVFGILLGVLAINRLMRSFATKKRRSFWSMYSLIYTICVIEDTLTLVVIDATFNAGPFTCFLPMTYLFCGWLWIDYGDLISTRGRFLRRSRRIIVDRAVNSSHDEALEPQEA